MNLPEHLDAVNLIASALDYAVLKPTATREEVLQAADLVERFNIASICVAPGNIAVARRITKRVAAVIGFPHGDGLIEVKRYEAARSIDYGASELDVVINYGRFLNNHYTEVASELRQIIDEAHSCGVRVKAILEACYYTPAQIVQACDICVGCGVDWVKTSTGFAEGGATPGVVKLMLEAVKGTGVEVKASGGIKCWADAKQYLDLGCTRIGSSRFNELLP
jgi:deoxyribose-phosphate aldolase